MSLLGDEFPAFLSNNILTSDLLNDEGHINAEDRTHITFKGDKKGDKISLENVRFTKDGKVESMGKVRGFAFVAKKRSVKQR